MAMPSFTSLKKFSQMQWQARFNLYRIQPWLKKREIAFKDLLKLCVDNDEILLLCDLLGRFEYLDLEKIDKKLDLMVAQIIDIWKLPAKETQLVSTAFDYDPDSSQLVLQLLKPKLANRSWKEARLISNLSKSAKNIKNFPNVVLVDEFVGSGRTIKQRTEEIRKSYDDALRGVSPSISYNIKVCVLASMRDALSAVERSGIETYATLYLDKGISDYYTGAKLKDSISRMLRLESLLQNKIDGIDLPSFGYNKTESLYKMELGNAPNSVFPIYWWDYLKDGTRRATLLDRLERRNYK